MQVGARQKDRTLIVELAGDWKLASPLPRFDQVLDGRSNRIEAVAFDASELGTWDSSLLAFLREGLSYCEAHDLRFEEATLPDDVAHLIELSRAVPERETRGEEQEASFVARLGRKGLNAYGQFLEFAEFTGSVGRSFAAFLLLRVRMRWRDFWVIVQSNSAGALPIVTLISFLVGLIISFLGAVVLRRFGAEYYVSYLISYGMLRELGALMTAIIMAGRTGAAFAAELGSMKITEEIDALQTLGISPFDYLVLPRVLALFLMMPLLTIYADVIGIIGGLTVTVAMLDISIPQFVTGLLTPVTLSDGLLGLFKGTVFGVTIGMAGCLRGLQTGKDAGAVGKAATSAVVTGITMIILTNAVIDWGAALFEI